MLEILQTRLYELEQFANALVSNQLTHLTWVSVGIIFIAGLLTSLTPCMLSMLPITIAYIGGYEAKSTMGQQVLLSQLGLLWDWQTTPLLVFGM